MPRWASNSWCVPISRSWPFVHHDDLVGALHGREAVGDDQRGASFDHAAERVAHAEFGFRVHAGGGFVEDQDLRLVGQGAGERDELLLAGGERRAALADFFVEALGQGADEVGEVHVFGGLFDVCVLNALGAEADISADGSAEQEWILKDDAEAAAQVGEVHFFDIDAVDSDGAFLDVVETHQQGDERGLAGAGVADYGDGFAGLDGEGYVAEDPSGSLAAAVLLAREEPAELCSAWTGGAPVPTRASLLSAGMSRYANQT